MNKCFGCGYMWADCDKSGKPITNEYCHFDGPPGWAPCEQDEIEEEEDYYDEFYGEPYDYAEF